MVIAALRTTTRSAKRRAITRLIATRAEAGAIGTVGTGARATRAIATGRWQQFIHG